MSTATLQRFSAQRSVPAPEARPLLDSPSPVDVASKPSSSAPASPAAAAQLLAKVREAVRAQIRGKDEIIELALISLVARGHLLIEDIPGVGKSTLARALAQAIGGSFSRIQFTSDLLPAD
ncbi:MAG: AAA family ATPase, partial [Myxococcales bacterium]|nr:AAA family ATPase [Myxococcales bacterium]